MNWYTEVLQKDARWHSPQACYDPLLLEPSFRKVCYDIIAAAKLQGETLRFGETFRSPARQLYLRAKGRSQIKIGTHQFGLGCDFSRIKPDGSYDAVGADYIFLLPLANAHPCPWGRTVSGINWGDDKRPISAEYFHDWDHLQAVTIAQEAELFDGTFYPVAP